MKFPEIDYQFWYTTWYETVGKKTTYSNVNSRKYMHFNGDLNACMDEIFSMISKKQFDKSTILRIVDLIYCWGGPSGRLFYVPMKGKDAPRQVLEDDVRAFEQYMLGVQLAVDGNIKCIDEFCKLDGIGKSFATKHAYFWSHDSAFPLMIVDSKISGALGFTTTQQLEKAYSNEQLVTAFRKKAMKEFGESTPSMVERALFAFHNNYFLNDNSNWKNKTSHYDSHVATGLAKTLFDTENS